MCVCVYVCYVCMRKSSIACNLGQVSIVITSLITEPTSSRNTKSSRDKPRVVMKFKKACCLAGSAPLVRASGFFKTKPSSARARLATWTDHCCPRRLDILAEIVNTYACGQRERRDGVYIHLSSGTGTCLTHASTVKVQCKRSFLLLVLHDRHE